MTHPILVKYRHTSSRGGVPGGVVGFAAVGSATVTMGTSTGRGGGLLFLGGDTTGLLSL